MIRRGASGKIFVENFLRTSDPKGETNVSKQLKGVGVWLIVLVLMIVGLSYLGEKLQTQNNYSYKELEEDLENHRVAEAVIHQNQQTLPAS